MIKISVLNKYSLAPNAAKGLVGAPQYFLERPQNSAQCPTQQPLLIFLFLFRLFPYNYKFTYFRHTHYRVWRCPEHFANNLKKL